MNRSYPVVSMVLCPTNRIAQLALSLFLVSLLVFSAAPVTGESDTTSQKPYLAEHEAYGMIACSAAYQSIQGKDFCGSLNPNAQSVFDFPLDARLTTMVLEVQKEGGFLEADEFSIAFQKPVGIHGVKAELPIIATWTFDETNAWPSWEEEGQAMTIDVRLNHDALTPQVAWEQVFKVCLGLFYNGAEVPEGYSPCRDV